MGGETVRKAMILVLFTILILMLSSCATIVNLSAQYFSKQAVEDTKNWSEEKVSVAKDIGLYPEQFKPSTLALVGSVVSDLMLLGAIPLSEMDLPVYVIGPYSILTLGGLLASTYPTWHVFFGGPNEIAIDRELATRNSGDWEQTIRKEKIVIGMPDWALTLSWGNPDRIHRTVTSSSINEQWVYGNSYVYVENGVVTGWQD